MVAKSIAMKLNELRNSQSAEESTKKGAPHEMKACLQNFMKTKGRENQFRECLQKWLKGIDLTLFSTDAYEPKWVSLVIDSSSQVKPHHAEPHFPLRIV